MDPYAVDLSEPRLRGYNWRQRNQLESALRANRLGTWSHSLANPLEERRGRGRGRGRARAIPPSLVRTLGLLPRCLLLVSQLRQQTEATGKRQSGQMAQHSADFRSQTELTCRQDSSTWRRETSLPEASVSSKPQVINVKDGPPRTCALSVEAYSGFDTAHCVRVRVVSQGARR
jgi:hypothetical protein